MKPRKSKKSFQTKGHFICIENDLIEIDPFLYGYFDHFLLAFIYPKTIAPLLRRRDNLFTYIKINVCVSLSSERETTTDWLETEKLR